MGEFRPIGSHSTCDLVSFLLFPNKVESSKICVSMQVSLFLFFLLFTPGTHICIFLWFPFFMFFFFVFTPRTHVQMFWGFISFSFLFFISYFLFFIFYVLFYILYFLFFFLSSWDIHVSQWFNFIFLLFIQWLKKLFMLQFSHVLYLLPSISWA